MMYIILYISLYFLSLFFVQLVDSMWQGLIDQHVKTPMGITAENLAEQYNISRTECDAFALRSQARWKAANDDGRFNAEMASITVKSRKGTQYSEAIVKFRDLFFFYFNKLKLIVMCCWCLFFIDLIDFQVQKR